MSDNQAAVLSYIDKLWKNLQSSGEEGQSYAKWLVLTCLLEVLLFTGKWTLMQIHVLVYPTFLDTLISRG